MQTIINYYSLPMQKRLIFFGIIACIFIGILCTYATTFIIKVPQSTEMSVKEKISSDNINLGAGFYFSPSKKISIVDISCDAICINQVGFPFVMYESPMEFDLSDSISLMKVFLNIAFYTSLSISVVTVTFIVYGKYFKNHTY